MIHGLSIGHEERFGYSKVLDFTSVCCFFICCRPKKISESTRFHCYLFLNSVGSLLFPPTVLFLLSPFDEKNFHSPPTSYCRALLSSFFMGQNCSSVSLSNFPYHTEKPSADLCHFNDDTYQSAAAALTTHSAVFEIIMGQVSLQEYPAFQCSKSLQHCCG